MQLPELTLKYIDLVSFIILESIFSASLGLPI